MFNTRMRELVPWTGSYDEMTALTRSLPDHAGREVERVLPLGHVWFYEDIKQEFLLHVQGLQIACAQNLPQQVALYQDQIRQIVQQDRAGRAHAVLYQKLNYWRAVHVSTSYTSDSFTVYEHDAAPPCEWRYARIQHFGRLIPPQALLALNVVEQERLAPDGYWVADKYERSPTVRFADTQQRSTAQRLADPLLSAQFGPYFIALAEWV